MWLYNLLKDLWLSYKAGKAAQAAQDLPAGQASIDQIDADGKTIEAQLAGNSPPRPAASRCDIRSPSGSRRPTIRADAAG